MRRKYQGDGTKKGQRRQIGLFTRIHHCAAAQRKVVADIFCAENREAAAENSNREDRNTHVHTHTYT